MKELNALSYGKRSYEAEDKHMESKRFKGKNHQPFNSAIVCYQCKCPGHKASECKKRNNTSSGSFPRHEKPSFSMGKPRGVCYTCQSTEHYANSCPQRKDGRRGPAGQRPQGRINEKRVELCLVNPSGSLNHKGESFYFAFDSGSECSLLRSKIQGKFSGPVFETPVKLKGIGKSEDSMLRNIIVI